MENKKKKTTIILVILTAILIIGIIVTVILLSSNNKNETLKNKENDTVKNENEGYYEIKENTNEEIYSPTCNETLCVTINSLSFLGDEGGISFIIYPNEQFNKTKDQSGNVQLNFNVGCEDKSFIVSYDFAENQINEREIQLTCTDYLNANHFSISDPNSTDEGRKYNESEE